MSALRDLPVIKDQTAFNLARWAELCADPLWVEMEGKIETDRFGQIIMNLPAEPGHGGRQFDIGTLIKTFLPTGKVIVECPISTSEGVKVADTIWVSPKRRAQLGRRSAFSAAPEICVEVLSPSNTRNEIEEKRRLYFEAGAKEVWICERDGRLRFFLAATPAKAATASALCPKMPSRVED
jgi:Uma2 family endonuclease